MNMLLRQAKDMFVVISGSAGLILILFLLILMIVLKRGILNSSRGLVVKATGMKGNPFSFPLSQLERIRNKRGYQA